MKNGWEIKEKAETVSICNFENEFSVPKYEIIVTSDLGFNILVYNWVLPKSNELHINYKSSFKNITLPTMMSELNNIYFCKGVSYKTNTIISQIIPKTFSEKASVPFFSYDYDYD